MNALVDERRVHPRQSFKLLLSLWEDKPFSSKDGNPAMVLNVSRGGALIAAKNPLEIGTWIQPKKIKKKKNEKNIPSYLASSLVGMAQVVREEPGDFDENIPESQKLYKYGIAFANNKTKALQYQIFKSLPKFVALLILLGTFNVLYLKWFNFFYYWYQPALNTYSIFIFLYIFSRFGFSIFYTPPPDVGYQPSITVIIACKNEEESIRQTIDCVYWSDYPRDRLEVIVVNDGSTDATLSEMEKAAKEFPTLRIVNFETNRGKRHGMAAGAKLATGDILVYIDSDSFIKPDGLYQIVQGFHDPEVGAVCGHANVTNAKTNLLTKMQEVRYFVAFRVIKAAESLFSAVSCCSGCFAAYRRSYVIPILDTWLNQSFLGIPATFGDDRSLTNFMLRKYQVIYNSRAVCTTLVPDNFKTFFRQQLRWKKSWIRESLLACMFMWRRHPVAAFFFYCGVLFPLISPLIVLNALVLPLIGFGNFSYLYIYGAVLMATLYSFVYLAFYRNRLWIYGVTFSLFYMLVLVWQTYYAFLTVRQNHWGTR